MFFYSIQCSGKKTFFIKVNCCYEFFLGATLFLCLIQVFGEKSVFYINFRNDSTTLAAKLRKNWLRIIHVKFPELTLFFDCVCDCSEFVFINFFQKKKKNQNPSGSMLFANMFQKILLYYDFHIFTNK